MTTETQLQSHLGWLARFTRCWLDSHRRSLRSSVSTPDATRRQNEARDFWKFCRGGHVVQILKLQSDRTLAEFGHCPHRLESDLEEMAKECHPQAHLQCVTSDEVPKLLTAILENQSLLAAEIVRLSSYVRHNETGPIVQETFPENHARRDPGNLRAA